MRLLIGDWPCLSPFLRYGQFSVEKRTFYPSHSIPNLKKFPLHWIAEILQAANHRTRFV